jgi:transposase
VLSRRVLTRLLGVDALAVRVDSVDVVDDEVVVWLRPRSKLRSRCPTCGARCPGYDPGRPRRWRALDFGRMKVFIAYQPPRVACPHHGVGVAAVPWARPGARHTRGVRATGGSVCCGDVLQRSVAAVALLVADDT